jgi:hypothetical protein
MVVPFLLMTNQSCHHHHGRNFRVSIHVKKNGLRVAFKLHSTLDTHHSWHGSWLVGTITDCSFGRAGRVHEVHLPFWLLWMGVTNSSVIYYSLIVIIIINHQSIHHDFIRDSVHTGRHRAFDFVESCNCCSLVLTGSLVRNAVNYVSTFQKW